MTQDCGPFDVDELMVVEEANNALAALRTLQQAEEPVARLAAFLRTAKPKVRETKAAVAALKRRQAAQVAEVFEENPEGGREVLKVATGKLAGEQPKATFEAAEEALSAEDVTAMFRAINGSKKQPFTKINIGTALEKVMLGELPQRAEIRLLEDMFGIELARALLKHLPTSLGKQIGDVALEVANLPRAILSSWDLSAPLRQGMVLTLTHPKESIPGLRHMFQAFFNEDYARFIDDSLDAGPYARLKEDSGLFRAQRTGATTELGEREEVFMSSILNRLPLGGLGIRSSERSFITYLNKLRSDVFDTVAVGWEGTGRTAADYEKLASYINHATGRGDLGKLQSLGPILNATFFSPRLIAARFQLPLDFVSASPTMRKLMARDLLINVGIGVSVLSLVKLSGAAEVELNPLSSDWGKMRFGNQRIDFFGGFQPIARYVTQIATNSRKDSFGRIIRGETLAVGARFDTFGRFLRSKLSPVAGLLVDLKYGETFLGEKLTLEKGAIRDQVIDRLLPLFMQDLWESAEEEGPLGFFRALPAGLGVNVQAYGDSAQEAYEAKYGLDYNPDTDRFIVDSDPDLRHLLKPSESSQKLDRIAEDFAVPLHDLAEGVRDDRDGAHEAFREGYSNFVTRMVGAVAAEYFDGDFPGPSSEEGRLLDEYYNIRPEQYLDEFFNVQWSEYNADRDAVLSQLRPELRDAINDRLRLPPELEDVERQFKAARDANSALYEIPKYDGISSEDMGSVRDLRTATAWWRDDPANRTASGNLLSIKTALRRVAGEDNDFTPEILGIAIRLQSDKTARRLITDAYMQHLTDNWDVLNRFYPDLYPEYILKAIGRP